MHVDSSQNHSPNNQLDVDYGFLNSPKALEALGGGEETYQAYVESELDKAGAEVYARQGPDGYAEFMRRRYDGSIAGAAAVKRAVSPEADYKEASSVADSSPESPVETAEVDGYLNKLQTTSLFAAAQERGYASVFGGDLNLSEASNAFHPKVVHEFVYDTKKHGRIPFNMGFAKAVETGANVGKLVTERPLERYKFYSSLDLSTDEKKAHAEEFMAEVHKLAAEQELSMALKVEDHDYDSCNVYTWDPEPMAKIFEELYPKYPDIWNSVEHPLQGAVGTIDPKHVGYVQEPIGGIDGGSHSSRMRQLGKVLDANGGVVNATTWEEACLEAGVRPDAPWLISDAAAGAYTAEQERRRAAK